MGGVNTETRAKWCFGATATAEGGAVLGSTGAGTRVDVRGQGREYAFYVETDASATCSYQILTARQSAGSIGAILSSGTLTSNATAFFQVTGPLSFVWPRIKTLTSTSVNVTVELWGT